MNMGKFSNVKLHYSSRIPVPLVLDSDNVHALRIYIHYSRDEEVRLPLREEVMEMMDIGRKTFQVAMSILEGLGLAVLVAGVADEGFNGKHWVIKGQLVLPDAKKEERIQALTAENEYLTSYDGYVIKYYVEAELELKLKLLKIIYSSKEHREMKRHPDYDRDYWLDSFLNYAWMNGIEYSDRAMLKLFVRHNEYLGTKVKSKEYYEAKEADEYEDLITKVWNLEVKAVPNFSKVGPHENHERAAIRAIINRSSLTFDEMLIFTAFTHLVDNFDKVFAWLDYYDGDFYEKKMWDDLKKYYADALDTFVRHGNNPAYKARCAKVRNFLKNEGYWKNQAPWKSLSEKLGLKVTFPK